MVAMTHEAYAEAYSYALSAGPEIWELARSRRQASGDMIKIALGHLEAEGIVRREDRVPESAPQMSWPVYALVPPEARKPRQTTPELRVVEGGSQPR